MAAFGKFLRWAPPSAVTVAMAAAGVSPSEATSNLAAWWQLSGYKAPAWIADPRTDYRVLIFGIIIICVWLIGLLLTKNTTELANLPSTHTPTRTDPVWAAVAFAKNGKWGDDLTIFGDDDVQFERCVYAVEQAAFDGSITVWGVPHSDKWAELNCLYQPIEAAHWKDHGLDSLALLEGICRTEQRSVPRKYSYTDLMVDRLECERALKPKPSSLLRSEGVCVGTQIINSSSQGTSALIHNEGIMKGTSIQDVVSDAKNLISNAGSMEGTSLRGVTHRTKVEK